MHERNEIIKFFSENFNISAELVANLLGVRKSLVSCWISEQLKPTQHHFQILFERCVVDYGSCLSRSYSNESLDQVWVSGFESSYHQFWRPILFLSEENWMLVYMSRNEVMYSDQGKRNHFQCESDLLLELAEKAIDKISSLSQFDFQYGNLSENLPPWKKISSLENQGNTSQAEHLEDKRSASRDVLKKKTGLTI